MIINRKWEMPNSNTFSINCIREFISKYNQKELSSIDPFANTNRIAKITNDIDPEMECDYNLDAIDFMKTFHNESIDLILFDPPYSPRQISEVYKKFGISVNMQTTQASFWTNLKTEIHRILKPSGIVLSFGWNSSGIGLKNDFEILEILLVCHGGAHNDTICTAERKNQGGLFA